VASEPLDMKRTWSAHGTARDDLLGELDDGLV